MQVGDRPPSVVLRNLMQTEHVNIRLCGFEPCTSQVVRLIKSHLSKFHACFITQDELCRFCNRALPHDNLFSQMALSRFYSRVGGPSSELSNHFITCSFKN